MVMQGRAGYFYGVSYTRKQIASRGRTISHALSHLQVRCVNAAGKTGLLPGWPTKLAGKTQQIAG
jgi:hypothetical protein